MPSKPWVTKEQQAWFEEKLMPFVNAQTAGDTSRFITEAQNEWFEKWPELPLLFGPTAILEDLTVEQREEYGKALAKRKGRIYRKFYNDKAASHSDAPKALSMRSLLSHAGSSSATRAPQLIEAYSKLFYKDRIDVQGNVKSGLQNATGTSNIHVVRRELQLAYDNEPDEVKEAVTTYVKAQKEARSAPRPDPATAARSPADYQRAIDSLPGFFKTIFEYICRESGWSFTVVGGGPCPEEKGAIQTMSYHAGTTTAGFNFKQSHVNFQEDVIEPYVKFLRATYPAAVRSRRSLEFIGGDGETLTDPSAGDPPVVCTTAADDTLPDPTLSPGSPPATPPLSAMPSPSSPPPSTPAGTSTTAMPTLTTPNSTSPTLPSLPTTAIPPILSVPPAASIPSTTSVPLVSTPSESSASTAMTSLPIMPPLAAMAPPSMYTQQPQGTEFATLNVAMNGASNDPVSTAFSPSSYTSSANFMVPIDLNAPLTAEELALAMAIPGLSGRTEDFSLLDMPIPGGTESFSSMLGDVLSEVDLFEMPATGSVARPPSLETFSSSPLPFNMSPTVSLAASGLTYSPLTNQVLLPPPSVPGVSLRVGTSSFVPSLEAVPSSPIILPPLLEVHGAASLPVTQPQPLLAISVPSVPSPTPLPANPPSGAEVLPISLPPSQAAGPAAPIEEPTTPPEPVPKAAINPRTGRPVRERSAPKPADAGWHPSGRQTKENQDPTGVPGDDRRTSKKRKGGATSGGLHKVRKTT